MVSYIIIYDYVSKVKDIKISFYYSAVLDPSTHPPINDQLGFFLISDNLHKIAFIGPYHPDSNTPSIKNNRYNLGIFDD